MTSTRRPTLRSHIDVLGKSSIALDATQLAVFDGGPTLLEGLTKLGATATSKAAANQNVYMIVGITDKGRQNPINYLGGKEEAGNAALSAYWDMLRIALALTRKTFEEKYGGEVEVYDAPMMRVSERSDEGNVVFLVAAKDNDKARTVAYEIQAEFATRLNQVKEYMVGTHRPAMEEGRFPRLDDYQFVVPHDMGNGLIKIGTKPYSDLEKFSKLLEYQEMVVSLTYRLGRPVRVTGNEKPDFVLDLIRRIEEEEVEFRDLLPSGLKVRGGRANIDSPFSESLVALGVEEPIQNGFYVEVKLSPSADDNMEAATFIRDGWGGERTLGTRKGYAEIIGFNRSESVPEWGMRGLNTFIGKSGANGALSAVAQAIWKIKEECAADGCDLSIVPVDGHLRYHIEGNIDKLEFVDRVIRKIEETLRNQIGGTFSAIIRTLESAETAVGDVARKFELSAMGKTEYGVGILQKTNFLVNFIEVVRKNRVDLQGEVVSSVVGGDEQITCLEKICQMRAIFSQHRTIRDTADLVAILRNSPMIVLTREERDELENWFFEFANNHADALKEELNKRLLY